MCSLQISLSAAAVILFKTSAVNTGMPVAFALANVATVFEVTFGTVVTGSVPFGVADRTTVAVIVFEVASGTTGTATVRFEVPDRKTVGVPVFGVAYGTAVAITVAFEVPDRTTVGVTGVATAIVEFGVTDDTTATVAVGATVAIGVK